MTDSSMGDYCGDKISARLLLLHTYIMVEQISDVSNGKAAMSVQRHIVAVSTLRDQQALNGR
jgi:hypothetical protein